jgi:trehalose 6-phosphate synthase
MSRDTPNRSQTTDEQLSLQADRLIIVTNRGPVEYVVTREKTLKFRRGSGGVVTALSGTVSRVNTT